MTTPTFENSYLVTNRADPIDSSPRVSYDSPTSQNPVLK
jgi:hypothetical protein